MYTTRRELEIAGICGATSVRLFTTTAGLCRYLERVRSVRKTDAGAIAHSASVGFVPTMGALHDGHLSLIQRARRDNDQVVVSIFVNPLQFAPQEDLQRYPRTLEHDQQQCCNAGVDVIFAPSADELYKASDAPADSSQTSLTRVIPPSSMMQVLCGRTRKGHFEGVATVVTKLLNLVRPDRAYFGQKDAQQLAILKRIVADLDFPVELIGCPIVREASGLALSSRNRYLSREERVHACKLSSSLQQAELQFRAGIYDRQSLLGTVQAHLEPVPDLRVEYVELVHPETMRPLEQIEDAGLLAIAAHLGNTRLIDNVVLRNRQAIIAIDGPAGAGKSTVARRIARQLGLLYLDTGAMYRAVTWQVLQSDIPIDDEPGVAELLSQCEIELTADHEAAAPCRVRVNGKDVSQAIRSAEVTTHVSTIAAQPSVREALVKQQRRYGQKGGVVMDGRDIGTHVFPHAELKIFLTASVQERARRRQQDLKSQGQQTLDLEAIEQAIHERDVKDSTRAIAPLRKADDAIEIHTDRLTIAEVAAKIVALYQDVTQNSLVNSTPLDSSLAASTHRGSPQSPSTRASSTH